MTFVHAQPAKAKSKSTGLSFASRMHRGESAALYLSHEVQIENFGESVIGWRFHVLIGRGDNEGKLLLRPVPDGNDVAGATHSASAIMKGVARISVRAWDLLGRDTVKTAPCRVLDFDEQQGLMIELPDWCQPAARKARDLAAGAQIAPLKL